MISDKSTKNELLEEFRRLSAEAKSKKISIPADAKGISVKSTKSDILDAIQALEQALGNKPAAAPAITISTPEPVKKVTPAPVKKPEKTASASKKEDIELSYLTQEIRDEINALEAAKALKKQEYATLLSIEQELVSFVAMINKSKNDNLTQEEAQTAKKAEQEAKDAEDLQQLEALNQEQFEKVNDAFTVTQEIIQKKKEDLEAARAVETEQYTYDLTKKQKTEDDAWADELARREEAIAEVQKETAELQAQIDSKADLVAELTAKIDAIPAQIEQAKQEGAEAKEKELGKEHGYKTNMAKKEAEVAAQSLQKQIDRLKADYDAVLAEKNAIQEKLDKAREESNKLYMETVRSTGGVKILRNADQN